MMTYPGSGVAFCGRHWGKTLTGVERILIKSIEQPGIYWWVGLSWESASMRYAWRLLKRFSRKIYNALGLDTAGKIREKDKEIHLPNGAIIFLQTADNPGSLDGESG